MSGIQLIAPCHVTMPLSIPASVPPHILSVPHSSFDSFPSTLSMQLTFILHQVSLNPTGRTPGLLSRLNKRSSISSWYVSHGGCSFSNHFVNFAKIFQSSPLASPKRGNQCCRLIELVPPNPAPPESRRSISMTVSYVRSTGISSGDWLG